MTGKRIIFVLLIAIGWGAAVVWLRHKPPEAVAVAEPLLVRVMRENPKLVASAETKTENGRTVHLLEDSEEGGAVLVISGGDDERCIRFATIPESSDDMLRWDGDTKEPTIRAPKAAPRPDGKTYIDIMVAGDKAATEWVVGFGLTLRDFAALSVERMNKVLNNSGLGDRFAFRLIDVMSLRGEAGGDHRSVLAALLTGSTVGKADMSAVRKRRDEVHADLVVTLIVGNSDLAGIAASGPVQIGDRLYSERAYCVCSVAAAIANNTMTHEVGHLLGAGHGTEQKQYPGPGRFPYSAGYYKKDWCTVMAYIDEKHPRRIAYFSNPDVLFQGDPTGDANHDNAKTIAKGFVAVSNFRGSISDDETGIKPSRTLDSGALGKLIEGGGTSSPRRTGKATVSVDDLYSRVVESGTTGSETDGGAPFLAEGAVLNFNANEFRLEIADALGEDIELDEESLPDGVRLMQLPDGTIIPAKEEAAAAEKSQLVLKEDMETGYIEGGFVVRYTSAIGDGELKVDIDGLMFEGGEAAGVASADDIGGLWFMTIAPEEESSPEEKPAPEKVPETEEDGGKE